MMKITTILLSFILLFVSCRNNISEGDILEGEFVLLDSMSIDIQMPYNFAASNLQVIEKSDGKEYLLINDMQYFKLFEINLTDRKLNRVIDLSSIENLTYRSFQFHYINDDSILIFRDPIFDRQFMDNAFVFVNSEGELFGKVDFSESNFRLKGRQIPDSLLAVIDDYVYPFLFFDNKIIFGLGPFMGKNRLIFSKRAEDDIPLFGSIDVSNSIYEKIDLFEAANVDIGFTKKQSPFAYTVSPEGKLFYAFGFEPKLSGFDLVSNKAIKLNEANVYYLMEAPEPLSINEEEEDYPLGNHSAIFYKMFFDNDLGAVVRFGYLPYSTSNLASSQMVHLRSKLKIFSVFSNDLRLKAEGVVPTWFVGNFSSPVNSRRGLVTLKLDSACATCIPLAFFAINTKPSSIQKLQALKDSLNKLANEFVQTNQYEEDQRLANFFVDESTVVLMFPAYGCPACIMGYLRNLNENVDKLMDQDLLIIIGDYDYSGTKGIIANLESNLSNLLVMDLDDLSDIFPVGEQTPILFKWDGAMKLHKVVLGNSPKSLFFEIDSLRLSN